MDERKRTTQILKISYSSVNLLFKVTLLFLFLFIFIVGWAYSQFPSDKEIKGCLLTKMYKVKLCPDTGNYTPLALISPYLQKSVVLTEDSTFWEHNGFDFHELENSFKKNMEAGKFARGGSTITQQLSKNLFLSRDKTLTRKVIEALITVRLEKVLTKKEILEKYLNVVQFGKNIFGVKSASEFYFKKDPAHLSIVESAFLTLLLPNPEIYSKSFHTKTLTPFAQKRLNQIIDHLYQYNRISEEEFVAAKSDLEYFLSQKPPEINSPPTENVDDSIDYPDFDEPSLDKDIESPEQQDPPEAEPSTI